MALESATYIDGLVITNPTGSDPISRGDDHIRLIKTVLKNSLPNITTVTEPIVKVQLFEDSTGTSIRSASWTDMFTFSYTKVSATSNLYFNMNVFAGLWNYGTLATGEMRLYNAGTAAMIGTFDWDAAGQWNNLGASASANNEVRAITSWSAKDSTPLSDTTHSFKLQGNMNQPSSGGMAVDDLSVMVMEIEQ